MGQEFDELAKSFPQGISRREALRRFGVAVVGGAVATLLPWRSSQIEAQTGDTCIDACTAALPSGQQGDCNRLCNTATLRDCTVFCLEHPNAERRVTCLEHVRRCTSAGV